VTYKIVEVLCQLPTELNVFTNTMLLFQKCSFCPNVHKSRAMNSRKRWGGKVTHTLIPASEEIRILGYQNSYGASHCSFSLAWSKSLWLFFRKSHIL